MKYDLHHIARILQADIFPGDFPAAEIDHLITDSRHIGAPANSLFFALQGPNRDGHDFIAPAYQGGVRAFVVSKLPETGLFPDACFMLLRGSSTLDALQSLAAFHRSRFQLPVIGITGSNGKTIVKEWLYSVLYGHWKCVRSPRSYNSQIGVPLSVWLIEPDHQIGIFEAGISKPGEMNRLASVIRPDIGIFTNIGPAHDAGFADRNQKIEEKLLLFQHAGLIIYRKGEPIVEDALLSLNRPVFSWSTIGPADLEVTQTRDSGSGTEITALFQGKPIQVTIPFTDEAAVENALHVWSAALALGMPHDRIAARLSRLDPIEMRLELREGINGCTLINDSYNADFQSLSVALHFMSKQRHRGKKTLFLSDFLEVGPNEKRDFYRRVARLLQEEGISRVFGIGKEVAELRQHLPDDITMFFFPSTETFLASFRQSDFFQEAILLKGARPFAFERIAKRLQPHTHRTVLEVDLAGISSNLQAFRRSLAPGVRLMVMVKAGAYGSGSIEVARLLSYHHVDYLAVAYADEGVDLRRNGIVTPILVLNLEPATFDALVEYDLEPEIYSLKQLRELAAFADERQLTMSIHLKLDTGMHRLGFEPAQVPELIGQLTRYPFLQVRSVFTHLAASESSAFDGFTRQQMDRYNAMFDSLAQALGYRPLKHALNSSGISRFPEYQMDMVRLGIGLYGIGQGPDRGGKLLPALTLKATVSQIRDLPPGETVSYGRSGKIMSPRRIATISLGYADGLKRSAGNGAFSVCIRDKAAPTVGNVCMDMTMVDVTGIPGVQEGDVAVIFGPTWPVEQLAQATGTIPYEVFSGISPRVKRVYVQEQ